MPFGFEAEAQRMIDILQNRYGYDPGGFEQFTRRTPNKEVFATSSARRSIRRGQLNSTFGSAFNEFRVTYQTIRDNRDRGTAFPALDVRVGDGAAHVQDGIWADLDAYIRNDDCLPDHRGRTAPRNCARGPWTNTLDVRFGLGVPIRGTTLDVTFDLVNLPNVFDSDAGVVEYPPFWNLLPVRYVGVDTATGKATYNVASVNLPKFTTDDPRSRWQGKFGVRWRF